MCNFFKITSPNVKPIAIASKNGWVGLIEVCDKISKTEDTFIEQISFWKFIKYVIGLEK